MLGEFTAGLYGHSHPVILDAVRGALDRGISYGGTNELEHQLAELLCARFPAMELVRFTNSGTEANLMALALAVHHTGRREILVFKGGYHGGVLAFGSGEPSPVTVPHAFVLGDYDRTDETRALIRAHAGTLGAILVEPMLGSGGCIPASTEFLRMLREEATAAGALLIFDEMMTSRLARPDVVPDLMTVGKYLAGGMSFGAFGGRRELMEGYDPTRPGALFHAGTFNNNVLSMSAGIAGLTQVLTPDALDGPQRARRAAAGGAQPRGGGARRAGAHLRARLADDDPPGAARVQRQRAGRARRRSCSSGCCSSSCSTPASGSRRAG